MNIVYVALSPNPPKGSLKNEKCPQFEQAAITPKRYEIGCQLVLNTRKSHTGFRLIITTSMTLNVLEQRIAQILRFFYEFDGSQLCQRLKPGPVCKILFSSSSLPLWPLCSAVSLRYRRQVWTRDVITSGAGSGIWQVYSVWRRHTNLKFGMAAPYQSAEI